MPKFLPDYGDSPSTQLGQFLHCFLRIGLEWKTRKRMMGLVPISSLTNDNDITVSHIDVTMMNMALSASFTYLTF